MEHASKFLAIGLSAVTTAAFMVTTVNAAISVPIVNADFESPPVATTPFFNTGPITGWGQGPTPVSGVWRPADYSAITMAAINGDQAAYTGNGPDGTFIYQNVGPVGGPGTVYDLSVLVGQRDDGAFPATDYTIALGSVLGGTFTAWASVTNPVTPVSGDWVTANLQFTNTTHTGDLYIILNGGIQGTQGPADAFQTSWDNVSLTASTPEPASLVVWSLLGIVGLSVGVWRRKRVA